MGKIRVGNNEKQKKKWFLSKVTLLINANDDHQLNFRPSVILLVSEVLEIVKIEKNRTGFPDSDDMLVVQKIYSFSMMMNFPLVFQLVGCVSPLYPIICQSFHF